MPDTPDDRAQSGRSRQPPPGWGDVFARLPGETPPMMAWQRVAASLDDRGARAPARRKHRRIGGWLALAATLALAVAQPWRHQSAPAIAPWTPGSIAATVGGSPASVVAVPVLADLQAESALLETLLAHARDGSVASGSAIAMTAELEARLAAIDAALAQPGLATTREHALWAKRVQALRALASFEGTRRWLAANGAHYDGVLVQVN